MSNVAIFKPNETPRYLRSVNTPDHEGDPNILINPDVSALQNVELKHWKRVGNNIVEMNASEKQVIADAELFQRKSVADNYGIDLKVALTALVKVFNKRLPSGQKITKAEMITALKEEIT